ncbi:MAG: ATP-binding cassette domain-containing protein, partial [Methanosarcinales archaeon]|nr:ATP-binding cassette domain-containing protein [Methanosarcinales archaeon]
KTTLSKILMGQISPTKESLVDVRVGDEWINMKEKGPMNLGRATKHMGLLHQEYSLYPHRTVLDNLTESIGLDLPGELGERKVIRTLTTTGFTEEKAIEILDKYPRQLSQGEDHRVAMAQILIKEPRIVILDEPTGTMDPATRVDISNSILNARENTGETFIIISHDMDFVMDVCDRAILMRGGKIIREGLPEGVLKVLNEGERKEMVKNK